MELAYSVNPGIEDIAAEEVVAEMGGTTTYRMMTGYVFHKPASFSENAIMRLRSINRAYILLWRGRICGKLDDLLGIREKILQEIKGLEEYITPATSFAVSAERIGTHEFTSMDIARVIGDIVITYIERFYGRRPPVDLRKPNVVVFAFQRFEELIVGVSLTGTRSMHRRGYRVYDHPAALKPTLAYAMLRLSGTKDHDVIVDPMCGGGTIPIEAALIHEDAEIKGLDKNPHHIMGAKLNALAAGVRDKIFFGVWDARRLHELSEEFDHIISNPPYGIRYGSPAVIRRLYREFLISASKCLTSRGRITIITTEYNYVNKIIDGLGLRIVHERTVYHGSLYPHIIVLERE